MFSFWKNKRPIIPTRLPEPDIPEGEAVKSEVKPEAIAKEAPAPEVIAGNEKSENSLAPPMTPMKVSTGEAPTEELTTVEEPTVTEANKIISAVEKTHNETNNAEVSTEETLDSTSSETQRTKNNVNMRAVFKTWCLFWVFALLGGLIAYYLNTYKTDISSSDEDATPAINFLLVPREKWDDSPDMVIQPSSYIAQRVVVLQTDTEECDTITTCSRLLNAMKRLEGIIPYNFLLATDGCIYEGLGWQQPSPLYPGTFSMAVGFIGDYETMAPSAMQLSQFQALLEASRGLAYLEKSYNIVGRKRTVTPTKLFAYLSAFERWDKENSEVEDEIEFDPSPLFDF